MSRFADFLELTKPRLTVSALMTAALGYTMGALPGAWSWSAFTHLLVGSAAIGAGANALNQFFEKDTDSLMKRTENRPLPAGRVRDIEALFFGLAFSVGGILYLSALVNPIAGLMALATLVSYVFLYTPLKRVTPLNTYVGAIPGALPPLIGWTAARTTLDFQAFALFALLFVWQLPHFFAIAWVYRHDYAQGGLRMLTDSDDKGLRTSGRIVFYSALLVPASLLPMWFGMAGAAYGAAAVVAGGFLLWFALRLRSSGLVSVRKFLPASVGYLFVLMAAMIADKA